MSTWFYYVIWACVVLCAAGMGYVLWIIASVALDDKWDTDPDLEDVEPEKKPIVRYKQAIFVEVGRPCLLLPIDHPSAYVSNNGIWAVTSRVLAYDSLNGRIETENTVYHPGPGAS